MYTGLGDVADQTRHPRVRPLELGVKVTIPDPHTFPSTVMHRLAFRRTLSVARPTSTHHARLNLQITRSWARTLATVPDSGPAVTATNRTGHSTASCSKSESICIHRSGSDTEKILEISWNC